MHDQRDGTVFPWRPGGGAFKRHDKDTHDRHGTPRCKHWGAPTSFVRFSPGDPSKRADERRPRLWVQCIAGANVAGLVDLLRICYREGWLGRSRRNHLGTERKFKHRAASISAKLAKIRVRMWDHGGVRREGRAARPRQANTALKT